MSKRTFKVAEEYSRLPGGRRVKDGPRSGEEFREEFVAPLLEEFDHVEFDLSGSAGYSTGWLDEAFGFLGASYTDSELRRKVSFFASDDPEAIEIIWRRIDEARQE